MNRQRMPIVSLPNHMPALDGLRGVAILLVLLVHCGQGWSGALQVFQNSMDLPPTFAEPLWVKNITDAAGTGVQLFFVVSAFTLTIQAYRHRTGGLATYAVRRIMRVGPGYWAAAIAYTLLAGWGARTWAQDGIDLSDFARGLFFLSAWDAGPSMAVVPGGWSISCEIAFYIALPVIIRLVDGQIWRAASLTIIALLLAQLRARHGFAEQNWGFRSFVNPMQQAPVFLLGVTAALITMRVRLPKLPSAACLILAIAIFIVPFPPVKEWHLLHAYAFSILVSVTVAISAVWPPRLLANSVMQRIGQVSYSMYLVHFAVMAISLHVAQTILPSSNVLTMLVHFAITVLLTFVIANLTYKYIERPGIALGAHWINRKFALRGLKATASGSPT